MNDTAVVDVLYSLEYRSYKIGSVPRRQSAHQRRRRSAYRCVEHSRLVVVALGAYPVEELAAGAEVEDEVQVVCSLQCDDVMRTQKGKHI